jgi:fumarate hydratase, class II
MVVPRQGRRESLYQLDTGATEDAASGRAAHSRRHRLRFAKPSWTLDSPEVRSVSGDRELWGGETRKAIENFPVSGEPIPAPVARWLGRIKGAAARVNAELGLLDADKAERIGAAGDRIAAGELDDQFPIDVFQTGSGTSSNTNANEVIASLAGEDVHANDDVNMGQSSNDVFPSAVHLAALDELTHDLLPALDHLADALERKAAEFDDVVKSGRTHLMDAVPMTLGQEFGGYAAQVRQGIERVRSTLDRVGQIPLGGTAVGTGLNTHPEFGERVRRRLSDETGLEIRAPADPFEAQGARDALVEASGALKVVAVSLSKIANDLRLLGSGPRAGLSEIFLPELQKGSSIMPGKVNPVIPEVVTQVGAQVIGNDQAITVGGLQGHLELNVFVPLIGRNLLHSIALLASACRLLAEKCVDGIEANREACERYAELTLSAATALNPHVGYDKATEIVKEAAESGRPLREVARDAGIEDDVLDSALDYRAMAKPQQRDSKT